MRLLFSVVIASCVLIIGIQSYTAENEYILPDTFVDVFKAGLSHKPTFGSTTSTCWARGGVCIKIRSCPSLSIIYVSGCTRGYDVCCQNYKMLSPTIGQRRQELQGIKYIEDLGDLMEILGQRNTINFSAAKSTK